jgi:serine/threonine-protein phosphatase 2A regulatory subunit A
MSSVLPSPSLQLARSLTANCEELERMSALDLWQSQLESGSTEAAVDAMKRLSVVAVVVGPEACITDLLPYCTQLVLQQPPQPDELLLLLGQELIKVAALLQPPSQVVLLLPILERLAAMEETVVREQAVAVVAHLTRMPQALPDVAPYVACVKRLAAADWFTAKVSACGLVAPLLAVLASSHSPADPHATALCTVFQELCQDETPMVRRAAAAQVGHVLCQAVLIHANNTALATTLASATLGTLGHDEQDSVRLLALASLAHVGTGYDPAWTSQQWLPLVKSGSTDASWYVLDECSAIGVG